jgi:signal transduction histidine kinase
VVWYASWFVAAGMDVAGYAAMRLDRLHTSYWDASRTLAYVCLEVSGLLLWRRRPESPLGPLLFGIGVTSTLWYFVYVPVGAALVVGWITEPLPSAMIAHLLLVFPDGRYRRRTERIFVITAYALGLGSQVPPLLVSKTHWLNYCDPTACAANPLLVRVDSPLAYAATDALAGVQIALAAVFVVLLASRILRAGPSVRRAYRPTVAVVALLVGTFVVTRVVSWFGVWTWAYGAIDYVQLAAIVALPLSTAYGLLRMRVDVAELVMRLERCDPQRAGEELAAVLGDPGLRVVLRRAGGDVVDLAGRPTDPEPNGQVLTVVDAGTWLLHDPALLADPALLRAVTAAARLTLDKARLQAEVRAQLREAQESRTRLARAALDERRRIERDLHDGTQQRLIGVGMTIEHARRHIHDTAVLAQALDEAATEVVNSLTELRELAGGLRPALLVERGLAGAIPVLARRTPLPVRCDVEVETRLPDDVEATVYFVVSEGLQNVVRHASASQVVVVVTARSGRLRVEVSDDGVGGAVPRERSGLSGLADRVAAVGGKVSVTSPAGHGTVIVVDIPLTYDASR